MLTSQPTALIRSGQTVIRVPPAMTGESRKRQRRPGKSDPIDALAVARTVVREGIDRFAAAFLDEQAMDIRVLHDHREQLIDERTRMINRLRFHLVVLDPSLEAELAGRTLDSSTAQARIRRHLARLPNTAQARVARSELGHIVALTKEIRGLHADLDRLTAAQPRPARRDRLRTSHRRRVDRPDGRRATGSRSTRNSQGRPAPHRSGPLALVSGDAARPSTRP